MTHVPFQTHADLPTTVAERGDSDPPHRYRPDYGASCPTEVYLTGHPSHPSELPAWLTPGTTLWRAQVRQHGEAEMMAQRTRFLRGWRDPRGNVWCGYCTINARLLTLGERLGYPDAHTFYAERATRGVNGYEGWLRLARTGGQVLVEMVVRGAQARLASLTASCHPVATLGYRCPGAIEQAQAHVEAGGWLVDLRLVPHSRFLPEWRQAALAARFGAAYQHLPDLGNLHYRTPERPMRLRDATQGLEQLFALLRERAVLLLCGCPDPATCHRLLVCRLLHTQRPQVPITHLVWCASPEPHWEEQPFQEVPA